VVTEELNRQGVACGKRRVRRLMRLAGLEGRAKKQWCKTTIADPDVQWAKDLIPARVRPVRRDRPARRRRHHPHLHLGRVGVPGHGDRSRLAQGGRLGARRPHAHQLVIDALEMAFISRRPPPGASPFEPGQYTSADYGAFARANGVVLSVGMAGQRWDNAAAESFFANIKRELIDACAWPTRARPPGGDRRLHRRLVQHPPAAQQPRDLSPTEYEATIYDHADRQAA
jgi:putative transposase